MKENIIIFIGLVVGATLLFCSMKQILDEQQEPKPLYKTAPKYDQWP